MRRTLLRRGALAAALTLFVLAAASPIAWRRYEASLPPLDLTAARAASVEVQDRDGRLLRAFAMKDGRWRLTTTVHDVDPRYLAMLIGYEDSRFYAHRGVDFRAGARAAWQLAAHGRVISGASTLTMQVARLLEPRDHRSVLREPREVRR